MAVALADAAAVEQLAALADPTRCAILELLRRRDQCVCHMVERLGLKQSIVSHHLGVLRRAGLVTVQPHAGDRRWLYYRLQREALSGVVARLTWLLDTAEFDSTPEPCPADAPRDHAR
jgi:DNA-binding transcriptional ArsR family regulator